MSFFHRSNQAEVKMMNIVAVNTKTNIQLNLHFTQVFCEPDYASAKPLQKSQNTNFFSLKHTSSPNTLNETLNNNEKITYKKGLR
jgi:hypothetical protein